MRSPRRWRHGVLPSDEAWRQVRPPALRTGTRHAPNTLRSGARPGAHARRLRGGRRPIRRLRPDVDRSQPRSPPTRPRARERQRDDAEREQGCREPARHRRQVARHGLAVAGHALVEGWRRVADCSRGHGRILQRARHAVALVCRGQAEAARHRDRRKAGPACTVIVAAACPRAVNRHGSQATVLLHGGGKRGYHTCTMYASYKLGPSPGLQRRSGRIETAAGRPPAGERGLGASRARSRTMAASAEPGAARHASAPPR